MAAKRKGGASKTKSTHLHKNRLKNKKATDNKNERRWMLGLPKKKKKSNDSHVGKISDRDERFVEQNENLLSTFSKTDLESQKPKTQKQKQKQKRRKKQKENRYFKALKEKHDAQNPDNENNIDEMEKEIRQLDEEISNLEDGDNENLEDIFENKDWSEEVAEKQPDEEGEQEEGNKEIENKNQSRDVSKLPIKTPEGNVIIPEKPRSQELTKLFTKRDPKQMTHAEREAFFAERRKLRAQRRKARQQREESEATEGSDSEEKKKSDKDNDSKRKVTFSDQVMDNEGSLHSLNENENEESEESEEIEEEEEDDINDYDNNQKEKANKNIEDKEEKNDTEQSLYGEEYGYGDPDQEVNAIVRNPHLRDIRRGEVKTRIAKVAMSVLEDPFKHIKKLGLLAELCTDPDVFIQKAAMLSITSLYKDIVPSYQIQHNQQDQGVKLSKEVLEGRAYERSFLHLYQQFLQTLEKFTKNTTKPSIRKIAFTSLCELLEKAPYFNFASNLIGLIVPALNDKDEEIAQRCEDCCAYVFHNDTSNGKATLDIVEEIGETLKRKKYKVKPRVLDTLLHLDLSEHLDENVVDVAKFKQKKSRQSRKGHIRTNKTPEQLENERLEKAYKRTLATQSPHEKMLVETDTLKEIIVAYVRLLKQEPTSPLLISALKGLAKFAHLINLDLLHDLMDNLRTIMQYIDLPCSTALQAVITASLLITDKAEGIDVDLHDFYKSLYNSISDCAAQYTEQRGELLVKAIYCMLVKPRKVPSVRLAAFIKRILTVSFSVPQHTGIALLSIVRNLLLKYPRMTQLLDNETFGLGAYSFDADDPEHTNPFATTLWEVMLLRRHYHPVIRGISTEIAVAEQLASNNSVSTQQLWLSKKTPMSLHKMFDPSNGKYLPQPKLPDNNHPLERRYQKFERKRAEGKKMYQNRRVFVTPSAKSMNSEFYQNILSKIGVSSSSSIGTFSKSNNEKNEKVQQMEIDTE